MPIEKFIDKIPFIGAFYSGIRSMANFFGKKSSNGQKRKIVLIQYPKKGTYHLAILLGSAKYNFGKLIKNKETMVKVFMPTTHFTMGYFLIVPENEIIYTDIKFAEAVRCIVSGGLIDPESLKESHITEPHSQSREGNNN